MSLPPDDEVQARVAAIRARETDGSLELLGASHGEAVEVVAADPAWPARFATIDETLVLAETWAVASGWSI